MEQIIDGEAFDHTGLVYGMGHAIYTLSDPRAVILKEKAKKLSEAKGLEEEFNLYQTVEKVSAELLTEKRHLSKPVCCNGIPRQLFTPIFAMARISGWCAHRMEEISSGGKIIRPAYKYVGHHRTYHKLEDRS